MRASSLIVIPAVFAAGVATVVLLQFAGLVQVVSPSEPSALGDNANSSNTTLSASGTSTRKVSGSVTSSQAADTSNSGAGVSNEMLATLTEDLDELRKQVQDATVQRDVMRGEIKELSDQVDSANTNNEFLPSGESTGIVAGEAVASAGNNNRGRGNWRGFGQPDGEEQYESLVAAGIDPTVAAEIKQRSDQWSLQRLELIDQATREGWRRSDQFDDRLSELRSERPNIRDELGDAEYDRYLFVSGESNRVQITNIIDGSAAQIAGMETGDLVRSYANTRVFTSRELQNATREGSRGESVPMLIDRSGQQLSLEIPRGPLGVSLSGVRMEPDGF